MLRKQLNQSVETMKNVEKTENKTKKKSLTQRFGDFFNTRYKIIHLQK